MLIIKIHVICSSEKKKTIETKQNKKHRQPHTLHTKKKSNRNETKYQHIDIQKTFKCVIFFGSFSF